MLWELIAIMDEAWKIALHYHNSTENSVTYKNGDIYDPLTIADSTIDSFLRKWVSKIFDAPILSEECDNKLSAPSEYQRMIDPIDWTKDFVHWSGRFSIMIWLVKKWKPILWIVYLPYYETRYFAEKNKWAYKIDALWYKQKITVSTVNSIQEWRYIWKGAFSPQREAEENIKKALHRSTLLVGWTWGMNIWEIAEWVADAYFFTNPKWGKRDICAPQVILEEAWWIVTDLSGQEIDYWESNRRLENWYVASNWVLHDKLITAINPEI